MVDALKLFLFKKQTVAGTPETSLVNGDMIEVEPGSKIEPDVGVTEINLVGGGFNQDAAVIGRYKANNNLIFPFRNFGASGSEVEPDWGPVLECSDFTKSNNNGYYIYTPSNTGGSEGTCWEYTGNLNSSQSLLRKIGNVKYSPKFSFDFSGDTIAKIEFTGIGRYNGAPTTATQPSGTVKNRTAIPPLRGVTMQIGGDSDYRCLNFEIDCNQEIDATTFPTHISGVGVSKVTTRKIKFSTKCYMDITTTVDPEAAMFALTEGLTSISWSTSNECKITANYCQITKVSPSEENGVQTFEIEGQCNRNDFQVRVLGANASSSSSSSSSSSTSS